VTSPTGPAARPPFLRIAGTLLSIVLLLYLLSRQGWSDILLAVRRIPPGHLILALGLVGLSRLSVATRWYVLLRTTDADISFGRSLRLTFAGLFAANVLPTSVGGDVVRLAGVLQLSKDRLGSAASIVADRVIGLIGMAMALPFGVGALSGWLRLTPALRRLALLTEAGPALAGVLASRGERIREGMVRAVRAVWEGFGVWIGRPRALFAALAFTWLHMASLFTLIRLLLTGMGESISFSSVAGLWSLSYFINLIPFSINGWGLREVSVTFIYSQMGGIALESALALALLLRTVELIASLPGALFVPGILAGRKPH
jgi:uncharacterized membrane protein YbhN (UPF0104 family)